MFTVLRHNALDIDLLEIDRHSVADIDVDAVVAVDRYSPDIDHAVAGLVDSRYYRLCSHAMSSWFH